MGKHEEDELRWQAEASIEDAERTSTIAGMAAVARTLLYVGEKLADRMERQNELLESILKAKGGDIDNHGRKYGNQ